MVQVEAHKNTDISNMGTALNNPAVQMNNMLMKLNHTHVSTVGIQNWQAAGKWND